MVLHVAEVILQAATDRRHAAAVQLAGHFEKRLRRVIEGHQLALQRIQRLDLGARRLARENALLDLFDFGGEMADDREVAVDHGIHQRVEHVSGPMLQELRLLLASAAHVGKAELGVAPDGHDVLRTDEDRDFSRLQVGAGGFDQVQHDEQRRSVFFDLRALMAFLRILDRQLVERELFLQRRQLGRFRILHRHPDKAIAPLKVQAHLGQRDVGQLLSAVVSDAIDDHARSPCFVLYMFSSAV